MSFIQANTEQSIYSKIAQQYINSFKPKIEKKDLLNSLDIKTGQVDKIKLQQIITQNFIMPRKYTEIILELFDQSEETRESGTEQAKTSKNLFKNLEILCGEHQANIHLLSKIDRTKSFAGKINLASMLMQPTTNISELNKRQEIIKELVENNETFENLNNILSEYSLLEKDLLNFFEEKSFNKLFSSENYFPNVMWQLRFILDILPESFSNYLEIDKIADQINKNDLVISLFNLYSLITKSAGIHTHITHGLKNHFLLARQEFNENRTKNLLLLPFQILFSSLGGSKYYIGRTFEDIRIIYYQIKQEKKNYQQLIGAYKKLQKVSNIISSVERIKNIIDSNEKLQNKISSFDGIEYLFKNKSSQSKLFDTVLKNLKSACFKEDEKPFIYLFFLQGKILSTAYLLAKTQIHLVNFIKAIGQIDAYLSIAKLYKESLDKNTKYCFSEYEENNKSHIKMNNFWSPFINQEKVVTNNIELGGQQITKCALISGPNAGGKSTTLKSIVLNTLLSQTITIAAADECNITPFSYIDTYLNITDNISGGNSLFKSEVLRVKNMLNKIENNGKSLIIVDEMFSGTNPTEGQASSYAIAEYIALLALEKEEIIALIASHYKEMTNLEENTSRIFRNYKVTAHTDKNSDQLEYPFTLQIGKSNQAIAIDILQAEGLNSKIIDSARKIASKDILS